MILHEISKKKSIFKNRDKPAIEDAVVQITLEQLVNGQILRLCLIFGDFII